MKRIQLTYYVFILLFITAGLLFVKANRDDKVVGVIENLMDKTIVMYSSNNKRMYINSENTGINNMNTLCIEGTSYLKSGGLNPVHFKIEGEDSYPYNLSQDFLEKNLRKNEKYVLIDVSRGQTRYGSKFIAREKACAPIYIILSKNSKSYDSSLLFAGRIKWIIDDKYKTVPVQIISAVGQDYNQSMGHIGMLIEFGDAANTYDEARESLKIFCQSMLEVVKVER